MAMNLSKARALLAPVLVAALPVASPAAQQEIAAGLSETIDVRVVNVEAVVTDRDGVPVRGLEAGDFRLLVDGEQVPIDYFSEIRGGDVIRRVGAEPLEAVPGLAPGERLGTSYLVFIDEYFTLDVDRKPVLRALAEELSRLGSRDRMALVAWNGRNLEMLSSWSGSVAELSRVLERALERRGSGLQRLAELRQFELSRPFALRRALGGGLARSGRLEIEEQFYAELLADQLERSVSAATATLRSFGAPPGRRVMLLLSGGWPFSPAEFLVGPEFRLVYEPRVPRGEEIYRPLADTANLLGYTLFPVDVPGLQASSGVDASLAAPSPLRLDRRLDFYRETESHYTLAYLADATGGRALINAGRLEAFPRAVEDTRSFYWLGFSPDWAGDDRRHEIVVEVLRPGLEVRSRDGYSDLSKQRQVAMAVESAVLFGNPAALDPLTIEVGRYARSGRGKIEVPLTISIPAEAVALLPSSDGFVARLELHVAVIDEDGARAEVPVIPIVVSRSEQPADDEALIYETRLRMRRKAHDVVVAVYDQTSGALLSGAAEIGR